MEALNCAMSNAGMQAQARLSDALAAANLARQEVGQLQAQLRRERKAHAQLQQRTESEESWKKHTVIGTATTAGVSWPLTAMQDFKDGTGDRASAASTSHHKEVCMPAAK